VTPEQIQEAARLLLQARGDHRQIPAIPESCRPATVEDGYLVQDELIRLWGLEVGGWKVGATTPPWQEKVGVKEPIAGRMLVPFMRPSPAEFFGGAFHMRIVEPEYAYRLGRDLPPSGRPYGRDEVLDAVETVHPAIEIVDSRLAGGLAAGAPSLVADNAVAAAFVYGTAIPDWRRRDLVNAPVRITIDREIVGQGDGREAGGDPANPLVWLANDRARRGDGLKRGQFVTTSSCAGVHRAPSVATVVADFGELGRAEVRFTG